MKLSLILVAVVVCGCGSGDDTSNTSGDLATTSVGDLSTNGAADLAMSASGDLSHTSHGDMAVRPGSDLSTKPVPDMSGPAVSFANQVKPLLNNYGCFGCHMTSAYNPVENLATNAAIVTFFTSTKSAQCGQDLFVKAGNAANSYLFQKISGTFNAPCGASSRMPLGGTPMTSTEQSLIGKWIDQGAKDN
jgi:hypothetical protein